MCHINSNSIEDFPNIESKIEDVVKIYKDITDIDCEIYRFNESTLSYCSLKWSDKICEDLYHSRLSDSFLEIVRYKDLNSQSYIFSSQYFFYYWAVLIENNNDFSCLIAGPVRTDINDSKLVKNLEELNALPEPFNLKDIKKIPVIDMGKIEGYAQLLYDIVNMKLYDFLDNGRSKLLSTRDVNPYKVISDTLTVGSQTIVKKKVADIRESVDNLLKFALLGDKTNSMVCYKNLFKPYKQINDLQELIAYSIGMISLIGQTIADSINFRYTNDLFWLYKLFIKKIIDIETINDLFDYLDAFFNIFWDELEWGSRILGGEPLVQRVINYIKSNYDKELSIGLIAGDLFLNPSYMCRAIKKETGITIKRYIIQYRLEMAASQLVDTSKYVYQIASDVGFSDQQAFRKDFKKFYNMTPMQYRLIMQHVH